jgi:hypothetical protein
MARKESMTVSREQAAPSRAATPARWRKAASYLALCAAAAASIATDDPGKQYSSQGEEWGLGDDASQSFAWDDPSSDVPAETWSAQMHITVQAPKGRWRVKLDAQRGHLEGYCQGTYPQDQSFQPELQFDRLSEEPWGDFSGRCLGLCPPTWFGELEFTCDAATCSGSVAVPVVARLVESTEQRPEVCVSAGLHGAAETQAAEVPSGVSIDVQLDPFVRGTGEPADEPDAGEADAGTTDAGATDAGMEGAADAS